MKKRAGAGRIREDLITKKKKEKKKKKCPQGRGTTRHNTTVQHKRKTSKMHLRFCVEGKEVLGKEKRERKKKKRKN